uniref:Uncharacterized protein n=1 Tax=Polytomella parva TaxID=51329 RepID=A0A7S0YC90_9CHLO|mmetsp:Transcript_22427/g.39792  ORF Transcript_22427/g.39792 Transcript_22427/m.39792 type:complete len:201 (+) Transcript_22427:30-632(+)
MSERWSRGCGSGGIGFSGHNNSYMNGVLIRNWVEDKFGEDLKSTGKHHLGLSSKQPFNGSSTHRAAFTEDGKTGDDLIGLSYRYDKDLGKKGNGHDTLSRHGDFYEEPISCLGTMNQLAHNEKCLDEPKVQQYIWQGFKQNDFKVPRSIDDSKLVTTKLKDKWKAEETNDMYATSNKTAYLPSAILAAQTASSTSRITRK